MTPHPPPPASAPWGISERLSCSLAAAKRFQVPANVVLAVATVENGRPGLWAPDANGSYDLGAMQLNTSYIASLARYGIRADHVLASGCYAYMLAAWRLHDHLAKDPGDPWTRVANYNSRTALFNLRYQARLAPAADAWRRWLEAYYPSMAQIGGAELAAPVVPSRLPMAAETPIGVVNRVRHHHTSTPSTNPTQRCAVARASMRVEMVFKSAAAPAAASPSS